MFIIINNLLIIYINNYLIFKTLIYYCLNKRNLFFYKNIFIIKK